MSAENESEPLHFNPPQQERVVTINRKKSVVGSMTGVAVLGCVIFAGNLLFVRFVRAGNVDSLLQLLLGFSIFGLCLVAVLWIRARWMCVAVIDEGGIIATTMEQKHDLPWSDLIGARTYVKQPQGAKHPTARVLLLLENGRCLEGPVDHIQMPVLFQLLSLAEFKREAQGQQLGTLKAATILFFGVLACILGLWWCTHLAAQWNNGILFQGNAKAMIIKIVAGIAGPLGGVFSIGWGLYHMIAKPILYTPGWIPVNE